MKLDILAFGAHPDDVEISCGGTLMKLIDEGSSVGIVDLTKGELGSRGSAELRKQEAAAASNLIGLSTRENLDLKDGYFTHDEASVRLVIEKIRKFKPEVVLCTAPTDRHPDHGRACKLILDACFYSGLLKIETRVDDVNQDLHRPRAVYSYIQDYYLQPDFVIDISNYWERKIEALKCFGSQFYSPKSGEPKTPISGEEFFDFLKGRAMNMGRPAGYLYAEGFKTHRTPGVKSLLDLI